jgi:hypothetical protein
MKHFFLVGSEAVASYPDLDEMYFMDGDVFCFDTETMTPNDLLDMADGWHDHLEITEEEFVRICKILESC